MDWELLYSGLTALGTVGAVIISLWLTLHKKQRFKVKETNVYRRINADRTEESYLGITFENLLEVQMEVHRVDLIFIKERGRQKSSIGWTCENEFIAPLSQYEIRFPLHRSWAADSLRSANKIVCDIKTSFGNKTSHIPKKDKKGLCDTLEAENQAD